MTKRKTTKHALLMSGLALLLCISMLIGSTYAWFTDSVTSAGNIIKSGTLEVEMYWKDATDYGAQKEYKDASTGPIFNYEKWEPGYVEAKNIKISNVGTLALKYQLNILADGEISDLANVIDVYYAESELKLENRSMDGLKYVGTLSQVLAQMPANTSGKLFENESDVVTIALKMQESAGNQYQDKSIGSTFRVQLLATQLTSEFDSFDDKYDADAWADGMVVLSADDLAAAFATGGRAILGADIDLSDSADVSANKPIVIKEGVTVDLNLNGHSIKNAVITDAALINNGTLTIGNSGSIANTVTKDQVVAAGVTNETALANASKTILNKGTLVINGGNIGSATTPGNAVYNEGGTVTINGGTFASRQEQTKSEAYVGYAFLNDGGTMTINNATVSEPTHGLFACYNGTLTVNGGDYTLKGELACYAVYTTETGYVNITGGNITVLNTRSDRYMWASQAGNVFQAAAAQTNYINLTGGVYNWDVTGYTKTGYKAVENVNGTWTIWKEASTAAELTAAIESAKDGDTICLTAGKFNTALDLQGKSLTILGAGKDKTFIVGPDDYTTDNIPMQSWAGWNNGRQTNDDKDVYALISANKDVTIKDLTVEAVPEQIGEQTSFRDQGDSAFVGIHVQSANATIENVDIKGIKPDTVTGNDHHNFGLYITSAVNDTAAYTLTYKNGTVSDLNRGGIYCWSGNYTLNFEGVTVVGPGYNSNDTLTPAVGSENNNAIYAFCSFYVCSPATYKDVTIKNTYAVSWWGGASWSWGSNCANGAPTGVTCENCGAQQ